MDMKEMMDDVLALLKAQGHQVKMGTGEILMRKNNITYLINPCNADGIGMLARTMVLNLDNPGMMGAAWKDAISKYSTNPTYDEWTAGALNCSMPPNQPTGPKRFILWVKFDTYEELKHGLSGEDLKGWLDMLDTMTDYMNDAAQPKTPTPTAPDRKKK